MTRNDYSVLARAKAAVPAILEAELPADTAIEQCDIMAYGDLCRTAVVDAGYHATEISADALVLILPGWLANDGNAEVEYPEAEDGLEAAQGYVDEGSWGEAGGHIAVYAWRVGIVLDTAGMRVDLTIDRESNLIALPDAPSVCASGHEHD